MRCDRIAFCPQAKTAAERIGVMAGTTSRRKRIKVSYVAAPDHRFVRLQGGGESLHYISHAASPFPFAGTFKTRASNVSLVCVLSVRQVTEFHRFYRAVHNKGTTESRSETQKQHLAAVVAAQGLHGGVIDHLDGSAEGRGKIELHPTLSEVRRFRRGLACQYWTGIPDRHLLLSKSQIRA